MCKQDAETDCVREDEGKRSEEGKGSGEFSNALR